MDREIKFRVWEKGTKTLLGYEYFNTILNNGFMYTNLSELKEGEDEGDLVCHSEFHDPPMLKPKWFNPLFREQFTGLKDKNGKDIYEGDIVRKEYGQAFVKKRLNENIGIVELCEYEVLTDSWGVKHIATGWNMEFSDKSGRTAITNEYEVIGNIHENPELITK